MAIYKDASITVGGTDLSTYARAIALNIGAEAQDDTAMGDDTRSAAGGLDTWTIEAEFNQSYASGGPDDTLNSLVGTTAAFVIKPTSAVVSATNPSYTGTGLITEYVPQSGNVGDQLVCTLSVVAAGDMVRATS